MSIVAKLTAFLLPAIVLAGCVSYQTVPVHATPDEAGGPVAVTAPAPLPSTPAIPASVPSSSPSIKSAAQSVSAASSLPNSSSPAPPPGPTAALEEVVVKPIDLTGIWKVNSPKKVSFHVGLFSGINIEYSGETGDRDVCELRQTGRTLHSRCVRLYKPAEGDIDGNDVTLRWWLGPATAIFHATAESDSEMEGRVSGGALGAKFTAGVPATVHRIAPLPDDASVAATQPSATMLRSVLDDIGQGKLTPNRYAMETAARLNKEMTSIRTDLLKLGALQRLVYLDHILAKHPYDPTEYEMDTYAVEFAGGSQLCGISIDGKNVVTDVTCH